VSPISTVQDIPASTPTEGIGCGTINAEFCKILKNALSYFYYSYIIWKDYNCGSWITQQYFNVFTTTTKKTAIKQAIKDIATNDPNLYNDPWLFAFKAVNAAQKLYPNEAYTVIVFNEGSNYVFRSCMVNDANEGGAQIAYDK
jgi:hypothetical protein